MAKNYVWLIRLTITVVICLLPTFVFAKVTTSENARVVAENWTRFIVERDGNWAGTTNPLISEFKEFKRGDMLLGYYAAVKPRGYIIISMIMDFAPIKAYSTESNLDPANEVGMCALLKDVLVSRNNFLIESFGGLDDKSLQDLPKFTSEASRKTWSFLSKGGSLLPQQLKSIESISAGVVGPLLKSKWGQGEPFNDDCPAMDCPGAFNHNAKVGCVPLAIAQVLRYFCWPPFFESSYYDWQNMLVNEARYVPASIWYNDENGTPWTQAQIDAVADLCYDAGKVLGNIDYACDKTSAPVCSDFYHDARDAFEDDFIYDTEGDKPDCEDRDDNEYDEWWSIIRGEIDHNKPMVYRICNHEGDNDFDHAIVVDGYDDTGGQHKVHANYGWSGDQSDWYELDWFDCDNAAGWNLRCEWDEEYMVRNIYPRNGISEWYTGTLGPWGGAGTLHHYIYNDTYSNNLTVQGGARVQFLPGVHLICNGNSINIAGGSPYETRFFSDGIPTRGLKVAEGGKIQLKPDGNICVY